MEFHTPFPRHTQTLYICLNTSRCKACWACVDVCPQHVLGKIDFWFHRHARIDRTKKCKGCLRCLKACSNQAILPMEKTHDNTSR
jgi:uncharacterized Fe-S center protein